MKTSTLVLCLCLVAPAAGANEIYRHVDAQGRVSFTDQPPEGAEPVELPPVNVTPAPRAAEKPRGVQAPPFTGYTALAITGVVDGADLMNPQGAVTIAAQPTPSLQRGHRIVLVHNGAEVGVDGRYVLERLERGEHTVDARVVDEDGEVLIRASTVRFLVRQPSALMPGRRGN